MKTASFAATLAGALAALSAAGSPPADAGAGPIRPNIVFILADDLGWSDLTSYGSTFHETPNLDRLAAQGVRFTQAYAASPVCSPTRASLLTGRYPARLGITDWLPGRKSQPMDRLLAPALPSHLSLEDVTFAEVLRAAGYRTASIGKWHLGEKPEHYPEHQGFDLNFGGSGKGHPPSYFSPHRLPNFPDGPVGEHLDDRLTREAVDFMTRTAAEGRPFLLYLTHYTPHTPLQARPEVVAKYERKLHEQPSVGHAIAQHPQDGNVRVVQSHATYAAMVESLDTSVGRVLAALDQLGLVESTLVILTSDNGGLSTTEGSPTSNAPLRTGKGWAYEGGVRVPLLVTWPGRIPADTLSEEIITSPDFFPTLLDVAGIPAQEAAHVDGRSFAPALAPQPFPSAERSIFWHYPHYSNQRGKPHGAVRHGRWKLIEWFEDGRTELFDLSVDIGETHDLASEQSERAASFLAELRAWRERVGARMPTHNPDYQPGP